MKEFSYRLILDSVHRIDFAVYCVRCILFEFDCVIPCSFWRESLGLLFAEYFGKVLVFWWDFHLLGVLLRLNCEFGGSRDCQLTFVFCSPDSCDYRVLS